MSDALSKSSPIELGQPLGNGKVERRAKNGYIRRLDVHGETAVVLKRTYKTRDEMMAAFRDSRASGQQVRSDSNYLTQVSMLFESMETYHRLALAGNDSNFPKDLPKELPLEELSGVFLGKNGEYWLIFKYYPPVNYEALSTEVEKACYYEQSNIVRRQVRYLMNNSKISFGGDLQTLITRNAEEKFEARIIDTELLTHTS